MARKDVLGRRGEEIAARYLTDHGYRVIARNWRCRSGEIDVIARQGESVVFVEVKTRSSVAYGHPFEAITLSKAARLRSLAAQWCSESEEHPAAIRIDAIGVIAPPGGEVRLEHLTGVC